MKELLEIETKNWPFTHMESSLTQICPTPTVASRTSHGALLRVALGFLTVALLTFLGRCAFALIFVSFFNSPWLCNYLKPLKSHGGKKNDKFEGLKQKLPNSKYLPNRGTRQQRPDPVSRIMKSAGEEGRDAQESPGVVGDTGHHVAPGWSLYYCGGTVFAVGKS